MTKRQEQRQRREWRIRRAGIKRGMKIAIHEVDQLLANMGLEVAWHPHFIPYTIAIAEGGRDDATLVDKNLMLAWQILELAAHQQKTRKLVAADRKAVALAAKTIELYK